jgi:hypothetical protein
MLRIFIAALIGAALSGCMSQISLTEKKGCTSVDFCASITEITYKGRAKDLYNTDFKWGVMRFRTGAAVTAEDPYTDLMEEIAGPVVQAAVCAQNPLLPSCLGD